MKIIDLTGERFNRLTVERRVENTKKGQTRWECLCDCGKLIQVPGRALRTGNTQSCGCFQKDQTSFYSTTHGHSRRVVNNRTRTYRAWLSMKERCLSSKHKSFSDYGGRGILICVEWQESFENFLADMGPCPPGLTLERIKNHLGYSPENCEWAPNKTQQRNKRSNIWLTYRNQRKLLIDWAGLLKANPRALYSRKYRGWSDERIITTPIREY